MFSARFAVLNKFRLINQGVLWGTAVEFLACLLKISNPHTSTTGKTVATNSPALSFPPAISEMLPTIAGLTIAPRSPANARNANIAVPALGHFCEEILIEPGHITPTAKPQSAQPASPRIGNVDREANK